MTQRIVIIGGLLLVMISGSAWMQAPSPTTPPPSVTPLALGAIKTATPTPLPPKPDDPRPALCAAPYQTGWAAHVVQAGDTLSTLMQGIHDMSVTQAAALNCIDDPNALPVGSVVWLPPAASSNPDASCPQLVTMPDCAVQSRGILGAQQLFQNGMMIWREDTRDIWVIIHSRDGDQLSVFEDTYVEGEADPVETPPATFFVPKRGFGKVWTALSGRQSALGWATAPEAQVSLTIQPAGRVSYTTYIQLPDDGLYAATVLPQKSEGWWIALGKS